MCELQQPCFGWNLIRRCPVRQPACTTSCFLLPEDVYDLTLSLSWSGDQNRSRQQFQFFLAARPRAGVTKLFTVVIEQRILDTHAGKPLS
jgi:hypothetical protein